jgi:hypothetical protein
MAEYIEKQALLKKMYASHSVPLLISQTTDEDIMFKTMVSIVEEQPTADVVEVKHGEWVYWQPDGTNHLWNCSVCGGAISTPMKFVADHIKYCEHCGAKMDGERKCDDE